MDTVKKIITSYTRLDEFELKDYCNLTYSRLGQDVRYALNDDKIRNLGWSPKMNFDEELGDIIEYYKAKFIW